MTDFASCALAPHVSKPAKATTAAVFFNISASVTGAKGSTAREAIDYDAARAKHRFAPAASDIPLRGRP